LNRTIDLWDSSTTVGNSVIYATVPWVSQR